MTTSLLLRIASVISLVFAPGHTLGGLQKWSPMGEKRSTGEPFLPELFMGFGWSHHRGCWGRCFYGSSPRWLVRTPRAFGR
jgi:hypothetical protein